MEGGDGIGIERSNEAAIRVLIDAETIARRVSELAAQIDRDYRQHQLVLVSVLTGSFVFVADLMRAIRVPLMVDFLGVRSYENRTETGGVVRITRELSRPLRDMDVLIVEDIVDTGLTADFLLKKLQQREPRSLRLAALLHKPARTRIPVAIDYLGFSIEDAFVVGYGLDHAERHRSLPYVGVLPAQAAAIGR